MKTCSNINYLHPSNPSFNSLNLETSGDTQKGNYCFMFENFGFKVRVVDTNIYYLEDHIRTLTQFNLISTKRNFFQTELLNNRPNYIICKNDTLLLLENENEVMLFLNRCAAVLNSNGKLIISCKNFFNDEPDIDKLYNTVQFGEEIMLTTTLEYYPDYIKVSDLLYKKNNSGKWYKTVTTYRKLRLSEGFIIDAIIGAGLDIQYIKNIDGIIFAMGEKL